MKKRWLRKLIFAVYLLVVSSVLLEIGVRVVGYSEQHLCDPIYTTFQPSSEIPYVHKSNLVNARARGLAIVNTDSLGLRSMKSGERYGVHEGHEYRIAIVGDSVTFGEGVEKTADTFAQVLEDTLNEKQEAHRVRVFNFGASAYSVKVMEATLRQRVLEVQPDLVVMAIIPSDFNLSRTPSVDAWGYLSDNKLSGFLPRDSRVRLLLRKVHFLYLLRDVISPQLDSSERAEDVLASGGLPDSYAYIRQFKKTAEQHKLAYAVVLLPSSVSRFYNVSAQFQRDNITSLDLSMLRDQFTLEQFRASQYDPHPSAKVHRKIGERLAEYILENYLD
jgi:hypothetical protein